MKIWFLLDAKTCSKWRSDHSSFRREWRVWTEINIAHNNEHFRRLNVNCLRKEVHFLHSHILTTTTRQSEGVGSLWRTPHFGDYALTACLKMSSFPVESSQSEFGWGALYFNGDAVGNFVNGEVSSLLDFVNVDFNTEETAPPEPITGLPQPQWRMLYYSCHKMSWRNSTVSEEFQFSVATFWMTIRIWSLNHTNTHRMKWLDT